MKAGSISSPHRVVIPEKSGDKAMGGASLQTVLFFDHTAKLGGGEIALLNVMRVIDRERFLPVVVLGADGPLRERLVEAGVETHILPLSRSVGETRKDALGLRSLLQIANMAATLYYIVKLSAFIRRRRPSVVHTNSLKADLIAGVAARLAGVPVVWHIRDRIADDYLPPVVARTFRFLCNLIPNALIANSQATMDTLSALNSSRKQPRYVIHDGVKLDKMADAPLVNARGSSIESPHVGLIGRLARWKGQHIFIRAAEAVLRKYPECRFQIIGAALFGEDAYEQELKSLASSLEIAGRIEFTGFRSDVATLLSRLDIVVHASIVGEPFGQVVIEAMAASKPVIATNGGAIPEILVDGITGILIPMGDAAAMASAMLRLIDNMAMAEKMGKAGRERVERCFTIEKTVRQMEEVFTALSGHD